MDEESPRQFSDERKSPSRKAPLPRFDLKSQLSVLSESVARSYHLSMIFSLADSFKGEAIENSEPALANNLRNLRDHDIGIFSEVTEYVGEGATFNVRRTVFPDSRNVVFKSRVFDGEKEQQKSLTEKLDAIFLELRVLTHAPLRHHENIVQLIQVGWQGDALDRNSKWPVLVVDYADRGTVADFFENEQSVDFSTKLSICHDIANGLQALHSCQIVHGDLKLLNVLLHSKDGGGYTAKLSDFGGALLDTLDSWVEPTGTPPWTAPEYHTERPREELLLSDIYALGLVFWRVMLDGTDPFADKDVFKLPSNQKSALAAIEDIKRSAELLLLARYSIERYQGFLDTKLITTFFNDTLKVRPYDRSLSNVLSAFQEYRLVQNSTSIDGDAPESGSVQEEFSSGVEENVELRLSLGGLDFEGVTRALSNQVLAAFEHTAEYDRDDDWRTTAASILAKMYLGSDDFGFQQNIDKGLNFLLKSAQGGCREDQGLVLRLHHAFGRSVPAGVEIQLRAWLVEAGATGSMTALEDMERFGYSEELAEAKKQLKTRYCGYGEEVFDYEEEALIALRDSFYRKGKGKAYIDQELQIGREHGKDLRGYFLRLSAAYGCTSALVYLVQELESDANDENEFGDSALLFAARSGHTSALQALLRLGANPKLADRGNDTPLHWLCSFDDSDLDVVADELVNHGAEVNSQAKAFPIHGRLEYAETEYVAGTPLHRAICRNKLAAVRKLLSLGADVDVPALNDLDDTPVALAALLHYPQILDLCLQRRRNGDVGPEPELVTQSGRSLLLPAMAGGSLHRVTFGRFVRHGDLWASRSIETMTVLCRAGASKHFSDLPGEPGCSAMFYAARCQPQILEFLAQHAAIVDLDRVSKRFDHDEDYDLDESMKRPPLFEAILYGKSANALKLLELGANARVGENDVLAISALYQCASTSFEDLTIAEELCNRGLGVDDGPSDYETPFICAVRNGCYTLADFLRRRGANVNALSTRGLFWRSARPQTLLGLLARNNGPSSISGMKFLLGDDLNSQVDLIVVPVLNHTIFHVLAMLDGDSLDGLTTNRALQLCDIHFDLGPENINMQSLPYENNRDDSAEARGGNAALHYAVIHANFEVVVFLLMKGANTSIRNSIGMTPLDIAELAYPTFEKRFKFREVPVSPEGQLTTARLRREEIMKMLLEATPSGVNKEMLEKFTVDDDNHKDTRIIELCMSCS